LRFHAILPPQGPDGKELIPAGDAAICRKAEDAAEDCCLANDVFWRDTLQFQIPTQAAVCKKQVPNRNAPRAESGFAGVAAPGQNPSKTEQIVHNRAAMGTPEFRAAAGWTNEFARLDLRSPW
jgi:hypothetical protein